MKEMRTGICRGVRLAGLVLALSFFGAAPVLSAAGASLPAEELPAEEEPSRTGASPAEDASAGGIGFFSGSLSLDVSCGYDGNARAGRYAPMEIRVGNSREEDFSGILAIATMEADEEIYSYEYPISVAGGESLEKDIYVPLGMGSSQVYVSVTDGSGREVNRKRLKIEASQETAELFVGLLSDHPERLSYLDGVGVSFGSLRTRAFSIDTEEFPSEEMGLDMLDVLVVNDYRLRNLTEEQTRAIMDWVEAGGVMILGTGNRVDDTLGRFAPELLDESYDSPQVAEIHPDGDGVMGEIATEAVEVPCVRISLHGGTVLTADDGFPLLSVAMREQGIVAVTAYDLGDIEAYGRANSGFVDEMFTSILGEDRISRLSAYIYGSSGEEYWAVQSAINTGNVEKLPNVGLYFLVTVVYIAIAGPGLYLFLKKRELRSYYGAALAGCAVVFTVILYGMGAKTRFHGTFVTYATVEDVTADVVTETSYVNLRNPYSAPYEVKVDSSYTVTPVTRDVYYYGEERRRFTGDEDRQVSVQYGQDSTSVSVHDTAAFDSRYFRLTRQEENSTGGGLTGNISYYDGKVGGSVTNQFSFDLENVAVILYGRLVPVGNMKAGETVELDGLETFSSPVNDPNSVASFLTGLSRYEQADINDKAYMETLERTNLLVFYMQNSLQGYRSEARAVAFRAESEEEEKTWMEEYDAFGLTMLTSSIEVNATQDRMRYRSGLLKRAQAVQGSYDPAGNMIYSPEPATVEYSLGGDLEVSRVEFCPVSPVFAGNEDSGRQLFAGEMYVYNHVTGNFDRMDDMVLEGEELMVYLSPGNELTVRFVGSQDSMYSWVVLPMPMVTGREI